MQASRLKKFIEKQGFDVNDVRYINTPEGVKLDPLCGRFVYQYMKKKYKQYEKDLK